MNDAFDYDFANDLLWSYFELNLERINVPSPFELIEQYAPKFQDYVPGEEFIYFNHFNNFFLDHELIQINHASADGNKVYEISQKGRTVCKSGGIRKHLMDIENASNLEEAKKKQEQIRQEELHKATITSANSSRVSSYATVLAFAFALFQYWQARELDNQIKTLNSKIEKLTVQHNALAAKGLVLPLPRLDSAVVKRKN